MPPIAIIIWVVLIAAVLFAYFGGLKNKKKYAGQSMDITQGWYEESQGKYSPYDAKNAYYFSPDKHYTAQGHVMVDQNRQPVYEAKILYGTPMKGYELDLINHVIDYKSHHKLGAAVSSGTGGDDDSIAAYSYFNFDGEDIWKYLSALGYTYRFTRIKLAYQVDVMKNGVEIGTLYSSNTGKNYFGCEAPYTAKMGSTGFLIVECADRDLDAMFLYAMAFARTKLSYDNLEHK